MPCNSYRTCLINRLESISHHITPLVINSLGGGHTQTHTHTDVHTETILRNHLRAWFKNNWIEHYHSWYSRVDKKRPHQRREYLSLTSIQKFLIGKCCCWRWSDNSGTIIIIPKFFFSSWSLKFAKFFLAFLYNSSDDLPIFCWQSFIMQVFANILPYQYFAMYGSFYCGASFYNNV